jgi:multidrug efflux pump
MVVASGASSKSQQALGTGVMGGMIAVVVLALLMVPLFYVVVQRLFVRQEPKCGGHIPAARTPRETADTAP